MKKWIAMLIVLALVLASASVVAGQPSPQIQATATSTSVATLPWTVQPFPTGGNPQSVDAVAVAFGGAFGQPNLLFHMPDIQISALAEVPGFDGATGDCGPADRWSCEAINGFRSPQTSYAQALAVYTSNSERWDLRGAHHDLADNSLISWTLFYWWPQRSRSGWLITELFDFDNPTLPGSLDSTPSFAMDSLYPHIVFHVTDPDQGGKLIYLSRTSTPEQGTCQWYGGSIYHDCTVIATGTKVGLYPSIAVTSDRLPRVAYYDESVEGDGKLVFARPSSNPLLPPCPGSSNWRCTTIDSAGDTGKFADIEIGPGDSMHIAYLDAAAGRLRYAKYVGGGGNCGSEGVAGNRWQCDTVENVGPDSWVQRGLSLKVDANDSPVIAYQDADHLYSTLKIAQPASRLGQTTGNCGPSGGLFQTWQCDTIDSSPHNLGMSASVALDWNGRAAIGYIEETDDTGGTRLKLAWQEYRTFLPFARR